MMWRFKLLLCCFCFPLLLNAQELASTKPLFLDLIPSPETDRTVCAQYGLDINFIRKNKIAKFDFRKTKTSLESKNPIPDTAWTKCRFNAKGQLVSVKTFAQDTLKATSDLAYEYDRTGNVLVIQSTYHGLAGNLISKEVYTYNNIGKVATIQTFSNKVLIRTVSFGYSSTAQPIFAKSDEQGNPKTIVFEYNSSDRLIAKKVLDKEGAIVSRDSIAYWKDEEMGGQELVRYFFFNNATSTWSLYAEEICNASRTAVVNRLLYVQNDGQYQVYSYAFQLGKKPNTLLQNVVKPATATELEVLKDTSGLSIELLYREYKLISNNKRKLLYQTTTTPKYNADQFLIQTTASTLAAKRSRGEKGKARKVKEMERLITDYFWTKY